VKGAITAATREDLGVIRDLLRACSLPHDDFPDGAVTFMLAREGKKVRGVAGIEPLGDMALLRSVAVDAAHRRHGLARELCEAAFAQARQSGARRLYLLTTGAERYFQRLGFVTVPRDSLPMEIRSTSEFSVACPQTATAMARDL